MVLTELSPERQFKVIAAGLSNASRPQDTWILVGDTYVHRPSSNPTIRKTIVTLEKIGKGDGKELRIVSHSQPGKEPDTIVYLNPSGILRMLKASEALKEQDIRQLVRDLATQLSRT